MTDRNYIKNANLQRLFFIRSSPKRYGESQIEYDPLSFDIVTSIFQGGVTTSNASSQQARVHLAILQGDLQKLKKIVATESNALELINYVGRIGWNSIFVATCAGNVDVVKYLLSIGADIEQQGHDDFGLLSIACRLERMAIIPLLLQYGADPSYKTRWGVTCLHTIARFGTVELAELIYGKNDGSLREILNFRNYFGMTALQYAITAGNLDVCRWLINRGADTRARGERQDTPFITACRHGNIAIIELFISLDKTKTYAMLHEQDEEGMNGLHHAVSENNMEATLTLISLGADVNSTTHEGNTPLHICAKGGFSALVTVLIQSGAKPDICDMKSCTPLHRAAEFHQTDTLVTLINQGAYIDQENSMGWTALFIACYKGYADMADKLLGLHANYMVPDFLGRSYLQVAVEEKHWDVFSLLIKTCDRSFVLTKDVTEKTALHRAASLKDTRFARALLSYEELISAQDMSGQLPLHYAASSSNCAMIKLLGEVTDNINAETHDCKTPLILACETGQTKCARVLIQMGANVNHRILTSYNPLMVATLSGSASLVEELIRNGVSVNNLDHIKNTALHLACGQGHLCIVKTLLKHGASVTATNSKGESPLLVAVDKSQDEVATFLMKQDSWEQSMSVNDSDGCCVLVKMTAQTPKAAKVVLDNCMATSRHPQNDNDFKAEFYFKYLETDPRDRNFRKKAYKALQSMILNDREDLLDHPVCQAFLVQKWNTFGRVYLMANIAIQFAFFVFALMYLHHVPPLDAERNEDECNIPPSTLNVNTSNTSTFINGTLKNSNRTAYDNDMVVLSATGMVISLLCVVVKEIRFFCASGLNYLNSGQFITIMVAAGLILCSFFPVGYYPCAWQWRFFAAGIVVYSYSSTLVFTRIDYIGLYFSMFFEVIQTILKMSIVLIFFVVTVAIPLKIFLRLQRGFTDGDPFPLMAIAMMVGELNYRDTVIKGDNRPFTVETYFYFPVFVLILNITFMNMMIGAAVGDIENVEKRAYLTRLKSQVSFLEEVESTFVPAMRQKFCRHKYVVYPNQRNAKWMKLLKRFTSYDAMKFIKRDDDRDSIEQFNDVIHQQNEQIKELKEITLSMKAELKKLTRRYSPPSSPRLDSVDDCVLGEDDDSFTFDMTYIDSTTTSKL